MVAYKMNANKRSRRWIVSVFFGRVLDDYEAFDPFVRFRGFGHCTAEAL